MPDDKAQPDVPVSEPIGTASARRLAEAKAKAEALQTTASLTPEEARALAYELRVHQIQLEMQNEELLTIQEQLEASRARYFDLYDLAPVGYLTLNEQGLILEGNTTSASFLRVPRNALVNRSITDFILPTDQDIYGRHCRQLLETGVPQACELRMLREGSGTFWGRLEGAAAQDESGAPVLRVVLTDITTRRLAEDEIASLARFPAENPHAVLRVARDGTLLYANASSAPLLHHWQIEPGAPLPRDPWLQVKAALAQTPRVALNVPCGDRIYAMSFTAIAGTDYINVYGNDVTQRLRVEAQVLRLNRLLGTLSDVNQTIVRVGSREELFDAICRIAVERGGFLQAAIFMIADDGLHATPVALDGSEDEYLARAVIALDESPWGRTPTGIALRTGTTQICNDLSTDPGGDACREAGHNHAYRAVGVFPLFLDGRVVGALCVYSGQTDYFEDDEIKLLEEMAGDVSFALESHRREQQRAAVQAALADSEEQFRTAFDLAPIGKSLTAPDGTMLRVNQAFADMVGRSMEDLTNENMGSITHPDDIEASHEVMRGLLDGGRSHDRLEKRYLRPDGEVVWADVTTFLFRYADGTPRHFVTMIQDITARKQAEAALADSEEQFRTTFENAAIGMSLSSLDSTLLRVNPALCEMLGRTADELIEGGLGSITHPDDEPASLEFAQRLARGEVNTARIQKRYLRPDGEIVWAEVSAAIARHADGSPRHVIRHIQDITARKQAQEALQEREAALQRSQQLLQGVLDAVPMSIFWKDTNLVFMGCNAVFARDAGLASPEEVIGKDDYQLGWGDQAEVYRANDRAIIESGRPRLLYEEATTTPSGQVLNILKSRMLLRDAEGVVIGVLGADMNISEWKRAQEALREREALLSGIYDNMPSGVAIYEVKNDGSHGTDYIVRSFNPAALALEGRALDEVVGRSLTDLRPTIDDFGLIPIMQRVWQTGETAFLPATLYTDDRFANYYENHVIALPTGEVVTIFSDVTEQVRAQDALRASEAKYRELVQNANSIVVRLDAQGNVVFFNEYAQQFFGYTEDEVLGRSPMETVVPQIESTGRDLSNHIAEIAANPDAFAENENENITKDGRRVWVAWRNRAMFDDAGKRLGWLAIGTDITARRQAEEALRVSEERFAKAFQAVPDAITITRASDGLFVDVNDGFSALTGYAREESVGRTSLSLAVWADPQDRKEVLRALRTEGQVREREIRFRARDGRLLDTLYSADLITIEGELHVISIVRDITNRKAADEALRASEQRFRELADLLPQAIYEADAQGVLTFVNQQACIDFGYFEEEMHGLSVAQLLAPADRESGWERFDSIMRGVPTTGQQYAVRRKDGSTFPALIYSAPIVREGKPVGLRGLIVNITDRLALEESRRTSQRIAWAILNATADVALLLSPDGLIMGANDAATRALGMAASALTNRHLAETLPPECSAIYAPRLQQAVATGQPVRFENERNGRHFLNAIHPILDGEGHVTQLAVFAQDITDLRHAEESARLATVGHLAAGVAHDFNNILGAMMMRAEILSYKPIEPDARELVDTVLKSGRRGAEICRNLMSFARPDEPRREFTSIETAIEAALALTATQMDSAGVSILRDYGLANQRVHVDSGQMEQVFLNLLINARHAMPDGGTLSISTRYDIAANRVVVAIADTGHGIPPDQLPHIFEPFFTTKGRLGESETPGAGLGLSVSHGIVTAHGGEITARSEVGVGTTFEVALPLAIDDARPVPGGAQPLEQMDACIEGSSVLVMGDDADFGDVLSRALTSRGIRVVGAPSVEAALSELAGEHFHLVLADVRLADGGAADLLTALASQSDMPQVLAMSSTAPTALREGLISLGAVDCIQRPQSLAEMVRIVEDLLISCRRSSQHQIRETTQALLPPTRRARVLLADDETKIRLPIAEALTGLGHIVVSIQSTTEAIEALRTSHFDLVISDLMMPGGGARRILEAVADMQTPVPVLVITGKLEQYIVDELMAAGAAYCLQKPFAIARLLSLMDELLPAGG